MIKAFLPYVSRKVVKLVESLDRCFGPLKVVKQKTPTGIGIVRGMPKSTHITMRGSSVKFAEE